MKTGSTAVRKPRQRARRKRKPRPDPKPMQHHQSPDIASCAARLGLSAVRLDADGWHVLGSVVQSDASTFVWRPANCREVRMFEAEAGDQLVAGHWSARMALAGGAGRTRSETGGGAPTGEKKTGDRHG